jgi:hypothetical protein
MKQLFVLLCLCLASCVSDPMGLTVKQYHLRENMFDENNDLMARGEVQRLLHGAVTLEERRQKVGQYYHVIWKQPTDKPRPVEFTFEYLQAGSGSKIKRLVQKGTVISQADAYFTITGNDYQKNGRVLAWRASVKSEGEVLATKRSYMWR